MAERFATSDFRKTQEMMAKIAIHTDGRSLALILGSGNRVLFGDKLE